MISLILSLFLLAIAGSFIQRVSGFGFGIFVMMFLPFLLPTFGECITVSGLLAGTTSLLVALRNWRSIRWKTMSILFFSNICVSYLAITYMSGLSNATMKRALGVTLILIALYFLFIQGKHQLSHRSKKLEVVIGSISGITGGVFAMPGPPIVLYCINAFSDKKEYIATLQALFCCSNIFYTLFRAQAGFFTPHTVTYWGIGLLGVVVGTLIGARCYEKISGPALKRLVYVMMIVSGVVAAVG